MHALNEAIDYFRDLDEMAHLDAAKKYFQRRSLTKRNKSSASDVLAKTASCPAGKKKIGGSCVVLAKKVEKRKGPQVDLSRGAKMAAKSGQKPALPAKPAAKRAAPPPKPTRPARPVPKPSKGRFKVIKGKAGAGSKLAAARKSAVKDYGSHPSVKKITKAHSFFKRRPLRTPKKTGPWNAPKK